MAERMRLGDILVNGGLITNDQLKEALDLQKTEGGRLGDLLVKKNYVTEQNLVEVLEFQLGIPHMVLAKRQIDSKVVNVVPQNVAKKYRVFPVEVKGNILTLGMVDPTDILAIDELRMTLKMDIQPVIVTDEDLKRTFSQYYGVGSEVQEMLKDMDIEFQTDEDEGVASEEAASEGPIVKFVDFIITKAVQDRASDIHIEPSETELQVRYRVDGKLRTMTTSKKNTQAAIISRIKIISGMNIAEKRAPQDGRIQMRVEGNAIDLRVSCIPVTHGEKIVMRILFKNNVMVKMEKLGFLPETLARFREVYKNPHGIILVTGPTGSGKSTTLSAVLNELNSPEDNIMTVEDPVEYQIPGINQVQVNVPAGLTFASALRSFLRQDPDIIMVGEIRDGETAQIATQAALTGHLVLSTLHTNDAPSSITRLIDMDIEPFLVASTVVGILAQRLIRGVCPNCKQEYLLEEQDPYYEAVRKALPDVPPEKLIFTRGKGCRQCNNTGYAKRLALHEVMVVDRDLRYLISKNVPANELKEQAVKSGMLTLFDDGLRKALQGKGTLDEVFKVAYTKE